MTPPTELLQAIRSGMGDAVPFATHVGIELLEVADGVGRATLRESGSTLNHVRTVHAGALFTLAETASGAAMAGTFAARLGDVRPVVSDAAITFRRPATGDLVAIARTGVPAAALREGLERGGEVRFPVTVDVHDRDERTVATLEAHWVVKLKS